ncbi:MAG TPA: 3-deoxy-8-phosphooctulonate synthase [Lentisphaeria bacterium]|nr:MAG: 3-deoxy-8-phosphooctulonate synthase [Lentisphaerae bacterium GWF2_49_21]HBC88946.1 3-deoxy-8-phosphooctulonate synthase [Lentisphaeria bacterium]
MKKIKLPYNVEIGSKLVLIAGPCVIESREICFEAAGFLNKLGSRLRIPVIFKASYDKANRSSAATYRGPGIDEGLQILGDIRHEFGMPVITDVHETCEVERAAKVVDILQIPAFLCRQTSLLTAAGKTGKVVNIKKGQFMAPENMRAAVEKVRKTGNEKIMLTERGTTFGYNNLVVDMRSLVIMRDMGVPVVFDATHSVQLPGGLGHASGGQRQYVFPLACAAAAIGIDVLFLEIHPRPEKALSDGPNSLDFRAAEQVVKKIKKLHEFKRKSL